MEYKIDILTGIRPTGGLTVANYLGAVNIVKNLQDQGYSTLVFVADLHALTDREPSQVKNNILGVVADYLALGIDPQKTKIFLQSAIMGETTSLMALLARQTTVAELLRVPTLKDKLKNNTNPENANALLLFYPVLMAADILLQKAKQVPVGEDQLVHLEVTRRLAERFNKKYGEVFALPQPLKIKSLRLLSLKGEGKMSKTNPDGALFLTDTPKDIEKKIKGAETAFEGQINDRLESHIIIAKGLAKNDDERKEIDGIIKEHKSGKPVMGKFKQAMTKITQNFVTDFQEKRKKIIENPDYIQSLLDKGDKIAKTNACETLEAAKKALGL
jgi:tryptophanyl-tRNA synthetase